MDQHTRELKKQKTETSTMSLSSDIPIEIHGTILTFLDVPSLGKMVLVSHHFRTLASRDDYWSQPLQNLIAHFEIKLLGDVIKLSDRPQKSTEFLKWMRDWFQAFRGSPPEPYTLENIYKSSHSDFFESGEVISEEDSYHGLVSQSKFETMTMKEKEDFLKKANDWDYADAISEHYCFDGECFEYHDSIIMQEIGLLQAVNHVPEHVRKLFSKDHFGNDLSGNLLPYLDRKNPSSADWVLSENDLPTKRDYYAKLGQLLTADKQRSTWNEEGHLEENNRCACCCQKIWCHDCGYDGKSKLYMYVDRNLPTIQLFHFLRHNPGPNAKGYPEPMWEDELYGNSSSDEV